MLRILYLGNTAAEVFLASSTWRIWTDPGCPQIQIDDPHRTRVHVMRANYWTGDESRCLVKMQLSNGTQSINIIKGKSSRILEIPSASGSMRCLQ
jgi:hypothetical protein